MLCSSFQTYFLTFSILLLSQTVGIEARRAFHKSHIHGQKVGGKVDANGYDLDIVQIDTDTEEHLRDFYKFVTRPDIDAPRWNIEIHDAEAVSQSPGYWFVGPYQDREQDERGGGWVGPHIYDGNGELVWSGAPTFTGFDTFDFRVANVNGADMLTMVYRHENTIILDSSYHIHKKLNITDNAAELNMHEFNIVDNGTSALMMKTITKEATTEDSTAVGFDGKCYVRFYGFEALNTTTWEPIFSWSTEGNIELDESENGRVKCNSFNFESGYDYIHCNAIDKFPDGDYLLNGRNTDAMYKISAKDGSVVWRFGGKKSDFQFDDHFSGQHNARVRGQNSTHTLISFLDNAYGPGQKPVYTNDNSRGLLVALKTDESPMTAQVVAKYDHPLGEYAPGRGNYQVLDNGNTFIGWTTRSLHSEYGLDGNIIMQASLMAKLKTYRSYKFPWVGHPTQPPDVHSVAAIGHGGAVNTAIYVSWNGATEVQTWNVYKSNVDGEEAELVASTLRQGFETELAYQGFASYVVAEAVDRDGKILGKSEVIKTIAPSDTLNPDVLEEAAWTEDHTPTATSTFHKGIAFISNPIVAFVCGIVCCIVAGLLGLAVWRLTARPEGFTQWKRKRPVAYQHLEEQDGELEDEDETGYIDKEVEKS